MNAEKVSVRPRGVAALIAQTEQPTDLADVVPMVGPRQIALSRADVMAELGISLSTVERLINCGKLPAFKVGAQWRIHRNDLAAYMEAGRAAQQKRTGAPAE